VLWSGLLTNNDNDIQLCTRSEIKDRLKSVEAITGECSY
jgi:hypothetical protein